MPDPGYQDALDATRRYAPGRGSLVAIILAPRVAFGRLGSATRRAADYLATVVPPDDAREEHVALVESMRGLAEEISAIAKRRDLGYAARFAALTETSAFAESTAAAEALRRKGYRLPT